MPQRQIPHSTQDEYWSERDQGLHHKWEAPQTEPAAPREGFADYSAVGGPENERAYGRTRSEGGGPGSRSDGAADRDPYGQNPGRGGYFKRHSPDYGRDPDGSRSYRGHGPRDYRRSDERVYGDVCEALTDDSEVDATHIEVKVSEGEVTLSGSVTSREQKRRAAHVADRIAGVRDVHNQLRIQEQTS